MSKHCVADGDSPVEEACVKKNVIKVSKEFTSGYLHCDFTNSNSVFADLWSKGSKGSGRPGWELQKRTSRKASGKLVDVMLHKMLFNVATDSE